MIAILGHPFYLHATITYFNNDIFSRHISTRIESHSVTKTKLKKYLNNHASLSTSSATSPV